MRYRTLRIAWSAGVVAAVLCLLWGWRYMTRDRIDAFQPVAGMTMDEVQADLGKPAWHYLYSDSGDPTPGQRFRTSGELGYGDYRDSQTLRKFRLKLQFEGWRVWDANGKLVEDHPLQLDSWQRNSR